MILNVMNVPISFLSVAGSVECHEKAIPILGRNLEGKRIVLER
jgi:hypothetical protein